MMGFCNRNICPECGSIDCDLMNRIVDLERDNDDLRECLREALHTVAYTAPVNHAKWRAVLAKASGEEAK